MLQSWFPDQIPNSQNQCPGVCERDSNSCIPIFFAPLYVEGFRVEPIASWNILLHIQKCQKTLLQWFRSCLIKEFQIIHSCSGCGSNIQWKLLSQHYMYSPYPYHIIWWMLFLVTAIKGCLSEFGIFSFGRALSSQHSHKPCANKHFLHIIWLLRNSWTLRFIKLLSAWAKAALNWF